MKSVLAYIEIAKSYQAIMKETFVNTGFQKLVCTEIESMYIDLID